MVYLVPGWDTRLEVAAQLVSISLTTPPGHGIRRPGLGVQVRDLRCATPEKEVIHMSRPYVPCQVAAN